MKLLTVDFETYYDKEYSLSKMTTEEYIRDSRFEAIGVSVQEGELSSVWFSGTHAQIKKFLAQYDWQNAAALAHNAMFDMAILNWHFGIKPKKVADTLSMARALHTIEVGGSLAALAEYYGLGAKGTEVGDALGKRRLDFTAEELARYGEYCKNDVALTYKLFGRLAQGFPVSELNLIDLTIRMFSEPVIELDAGVLELNLKNVREAKRVALAKAMIDKDQLMSNDQLAELLRSLGVQPPTKISPTTGKQAYAFAKTDEAFLELLEHDNLHVQALAAARLGVKSTIEESRTERLLSIATRGLMPIPLRYYAAHTGRWGGDDKVNMQNLPRNSVLKYALRAPTGYKFIDCDSSQIEARTLAWWAGQDDLVTAFERGDDVYKIMASAIYGKPVGEIDKSERFVGKTTILGCIAEGTLVLCAAGWKPIELVSVDDAVWDGEEWVCHQGLLKKGYKETLRLSGVWLTPDHKVLCGAQWKEAQSVAQDADTLSLALDTGAENLPSQATSSVWVKGKEEACGHSLSNVSVGVLSTQLIGTTLKTLKRLGATSALKSLQHTLASCIGGMQKSYRMTGTGSVYSTGFRAVSLGAIQKLVSHTQTMAGAAFVCTPHGGKIELSSYATLSRSPGGISQNSTSTASTTARGMNRVTYASQLSQRTRGINAKLASSSRNLMTYDLAYAGPRNRYTIATSAGPIIVHNCGYGMGPNKFQVQLQNFKVVTPLDECQRIIAVYRQTYDRIPELWKQASEALVAMMNDQTAPLGRDGVVVVEGRKGIRLPNGLYLRYPNLRWHNDATTGKKEMVYDTKKGKSVIPNRIYGGKVVENCCQAIARIIIGEQLIRVSRKYRVALTVHDAIGVVVPEAQETEGLEFVEQCMRTRPVWAPDLPLNCEGGSGESYGDC